MSKIHEYDKALSRALSQHLAETDIPRGTKERVWAHIEHKRARQQAARKRYWSWSAAAAVFSLAIPLANTLLDRGEQEARPGRADSAFVHSSKETRDAPVAQSVPEHHVLGVYQGSDNRGHVRVQSEAGTKTFTAPPSVSLDHLERGDHVAVVYRESSDGSLTLQSITVTKEGMTEAAGSVLVEKDAYDFRLLQGYGEQQGRVVLLANPAIYLQIDPLPRKEASARLAAFRAAHPDAQLYSKKALNAADHVVFSDGTQELHAVLLKKGEQWLFVTMSFPAEAHEGAFADFQAMLQTIR